MIAQIGTPQDNQQFQQQLHQIQHYTGQLAKDTAKHLGELNSSSAVADNRQWRLQKERLHSDFTKALNSFQGAQRTAAQKEKEAIKRARGAGGGGTVLLGPSGTTTQSLMDTDETPAGGSGFGQGSVSRTQMLLQEEDDMAQLQERERSIRQLEVGFDGSNYQKEFTPFDWAFSRTSSTLTLSSRIWRLWCTNRALW